MTKNVIIGVLVLVCIFLTVLSQLKATEAEKANLRANELSIIAEQNLEKAEAQERIAIMAASDAQIAKRMAEDALEKCKTGK